MAELAWSIDDAFLLCAAADVVAALLVPATLISGGAGATGLVLDPDADAYLAGGKQVLDALRQTNPKLDRNSSPGPSLPLRRTGIDAHYLKQLVAASPTTDDPYAGLGNPIEVGHEGYQLPVRDTLHGSRGKPGVKHAVDVLNATLRRSRMD
jgi:hypothetical protein